MLVLFVFLFAVAGIADQSFAMGKRKKGSSRFNGGSLLTTQSSGATDDESLGGTAGSTFQTFGSLDNTENSTPQTDYSQNANQTGFDSVNASNEEFPSAATVPEPATLTLMGMGLGALLLSRRKK